MLNRRDMALRMGHKPENQSGFITDARDRIHASVRVAGERILISGFSRCVRQSHLLMIPERLTNRVICRDKSPLTVCDR